MHTSPHNNRSILNDSRENLRKSLLVVAEMLEVQDDPVKQDGKDAVAGIGLMLVASQVEDYIARVRAEIPSMTDRLEARRGEE